MCDRFADSTLAYQGYGHGLGRAPIEALYKVNLNTIPVLKIHFVQTATNKDLFLLLAILLLLSSFYLFKVQRRLV